MNRYHCPHCGKDGISGLRRAFLGSLVPTRCTECGQKVTVPYWSVMVMAPFVLAAGLLPFVWDNGFLSFCLGAFGATGLFVLWEAFVPLVKR